MSKLKKADRICLAGIYNTEGKQALYRQLTEQYGIANPSSTFAGMKKAPYLQYDAEKDRFMIHDAEQKESEIFLNIDELCSERSRNMKTTRTAGIISFHKSMDSLIQELIGDRLLALSQYVSLDAASKVLRLDETSLKNDGYRLILH